LARIQERFQALAAAITGVVAWFVGRPKSQPQEGAGPPVQHTIDLDRVAPPPNRPILVHRPPHTTSTLKPAPNLRVLTSRDSETGEWLVHGTIDADEEDPNPRWNGVAYGAPVAQNVDPSVLARHLLPWNKKTQSGEA
jgi:hypothetical protein